VLGETTPECVHDTVVLSLGILKMNRIDDATGGMVHPKFFVQLDRQYEISPDKRTRAS
jgi:hypothetical protein